MTKKIINFKDVTFHYQQNQPVFSELNLAIEASETVGLVGANGAGKSTLLKLLVGINRVNSGQLYIDGVEVTDNSIKVIREKIAYTFQDADSQLFMTTVFEDVAFGPRNKGVGEENIDEVVHKALRQVEGLHLIDRPPYKLSGGEKRRVALATVLAVEPEVIILDEPATGLDPRSRRNLLNLMKTLDQTKIIATHDMDMALELCNRVIVLHHGKIMADGHPKEIFMKKDLLEKCHLEQPLSMQGCPVCNNR